MTPYKIYIISAVILSLFIGGILAINPSYADFLFQEDGVMEFLSIAIAGLAAALALVLGYMGFREKGVWRFWLFLSFLTILFIGESLSWGERIFGLNMPVIAGIKFDALHDILSVSIGIIKKTRDYILQIGLLDPRSIAIITSVAAISGILIYSLIKNIFKHKENIIGFFKANLQKPPFVFVFTALILIAAALIIDDDNLVQFPHKEVADEGFELLGIIAIFFSSLCGFLCKKRGFANKGFL